MNQIIIARYGEVHLKGKNRNMFLRQLTANLPYKPTLQNGRYIFEGTADINKIVNTFGITSASPCTIVKHDEILNHLSKIKINGTFKICVNRADKSFPTPSMEFAAQCGGVILDANKNARVDLHNPDKIINIDIRDNNTAFIYSEIVPGVGGMPVGTAGRAIVLLSGGIDSPVAAYLAAKRGLKVECLHFASPPYTSDFSLDKVKRLVAVLEQYCGRIKLHTINFTKIQQEIKQKCADEYTITLMRRFFIRIAVKLAPDCLITGENLGQVASQTIQGITTNNVCAGEIPILRPLVTYDKSEIIALAKKIGTYNISIEPHPDCCTVFVPSSPVIAPTIKRCEREERNLDVEALVNETLSL